MGEWLLPVGVRERKSKISLLRRGWGVQTVLSPNPEAFRPPHFELRKTFAPSDTIAFCKVEDGCDLKGLIFSVTAKARL